MTAARDTITAVPEPIFTGVASHIGNYADAVVVPAGLDLIHTSGTPGLRPDGTLPEDFSEEVLQAWHNIEEALKRGGSRLSDIVIVRQWLINAADIPAYAEVRSSVLHHTPTFMLAVVPQLIWPNVRVEIEVTAIRRGN